jgi:uncharacterized SAM-binding protein YcdF (DUF218 family)
MTALLLSKVLPLFVYPLGAAILVGTTALATSLTGWRRIGQVLLGVALVVLWIAATPVFANWLTWQLESQFPPRTIETLPQSDVVIILGGVLGQPVPPRIAADLTDSADRIMHALRIYRAGKAPLIVISAGNLYGGAAIDSEAQLIADFLIELGAPPSALVLETRSRNTRENAVNTGAIFKQHGWRNGLLVTSGAHMPRAFAAFQRMGLNVTPAATDIHSGPPSSVSLFELLPDAAALAGTTLAIKEMLGLCYYRLRGWA